MQPIPNVNYPTLVQTPFSKWLRAYHLHIRRLYAMVGRDYIPFIDFAKFIYSTSSGYVSPYLP